MESSEVLDSVKDVAEKVGDTAKDFQDSLNDAQLESLANGDLNGIIDGSDASDAEKDFQKNVVKEFKIPANKVQGALVMTSGVLGFLATLPSPELVTTAGSMQVFASGIALYNK